MPADARNGFSAMLVGALVEADRPWAAALVAKHFGWTTVVSRGVLHDTRALPGLIAHAEWSPPWAAAVPPRWRPAGDRGADRLPVAAGIGCRLLEAAKDVARAQACRRLWLITTNDNRPALAFYSAIGWRQCAVHRGAITKARRLKPHIPLAGHGGVPIEDEIEFECLIDQPPRVTD